MGKEIEVIEAALNDANAKGVYALADSYTIYHALQVVKTQLSNKEEYPQLEGKPKDLKTKKQIPDVPASQRTIIDGEPIKKKPTK